MGLMKFTEEMRAEMRKRLDDSPNPEAGRIVLKALEDGRVDGGLYIQEGCGCFYGWLFAAEVCGGQLPGITEIRVLNAARGCGYQDSTWGLVRQHFGFSDNMIESQFITDLERFVQNICEGHRPHTHKHAAVLARELRVYLWERRALEAPPVEEPTCEPAFA